MALTHGAIARAYMDKMIAEGTVLQIIEMKGVAGERYR